MRDDGRHACLLQHDFRQPDAIKVSTMPPRQISPVFAVPLQKAVPEGALKGWL